MRSFLPDFSLEKPKDLRQALQWLETGEYRPFAGGTDLMVLFESGKLKPGKFFDLWALKDLMGIHESKNLLRVSALTTYTQIRNHPTIQKAFPLLVEAARQTGAIAIQNRGTLGGNVANASPAADTPPALLVYDAEIELVSSEGTRSLPYSGFHKDYKKTEMTKNELISGFRLSTDHDWTHSFYRKVGTRLAQAISKVCFAGVARVKNGVIEDIRIAMGAVAPICKRCEKVEAGVRGHKITESLLKEARKNLLQEISPITDIRSEKDYRLEVAQNVLEQFLRRLMA